MERSFSEGGFTLIECAIVIALIGVLAGIAVPKFTEFSDSAKTAACRQNQCAIESACGIYLMDTANPRPGLYPLQVSDLVPRYFDAEPECPVSGKYRYIPASGTVECGSGGHSS